MKKISLFLVSAFASTLLNAQTVITPNISGNPRGLVIKNNYAYFVNSSQNRVIRIDLDNPSTPQFVRNNVNYNSYTLEPTSDGFLLPNTGGNNIDKATINGANISWNTNYINGTGGTIGFAFKDAAGDIYFTRNGTTNNAQLRKLLSSPNSSSIVANFPNAVLNILDVATIGSEFYFSTTNGRIWRFNKNNPSAGFTQLVFAGVSNAITGIEATQDYLYYVDSINNRVVRVNRANGSGAINLFNNLNVAYIDIVGNKVYGITSNQATDKLYLYTDLNLPVPCANIVNIPNANFKAALLDHGGGITGTGISVIDTDDDGEICQTEAQAYTGGINVSNKNISDLTGIEAFTGLTSLKCENNKLTSLDVSASTALTTLWCGRNELTSLNASGNTALTQLYCNNNKLASLDVSVNTALKSLSCQNNQLTSLNVANGNNANLLIMFAELNPNLTCIQHDTGFTPPAYDPNTVTGWLKDTTAIWSDNCAAASINDVTFSNAVTLYPNPASSTLYISANNTQINTIEIYNVLGKKVLTTQQEEVLVSKLPSGMYILKIQNTEGKIATKKFIKQ